MIVSENGDRRERAVPCSIPDCRCGAYEPVVVSGTSHFERLLEFDGCYNFRDLGRYATTDGRWTRPRLLFRADGPHALTTDDERRLRDLGLATIIDLRTREEVERGSYANHVTPVVRHHLPMMDVVLDPDEIVGWADPETVAGRYREIFDENAGTIAEILAILSDASAYPALIHCSAGKDRTGIVAAVLLGLMRVPDDTIVADYVQSETSMRRLVDYYQTTYPDASEQLQRLAPAMIAAHPVTMTRLVEGIRRDYGSFDGYAEWIGVGTAPRFIRDTMLTGDRRGPGAPRPV
jgi:protein-tyrosine phosphatase